MGVFWTFNAPYFTESRHHYNCGDHAASDNVDVRLRFWRRIGATLGANVNYINYLLPGILLMTVASGVSYTAMRLWNDLNNGLFERFNSMPIKRASVLWSHVLTSLVSNMLTLAIIFLVGWLVGFRSQAPIFSWLAVVGILSLFTLALTWVAVVAGLSGKSMEGATAFAYPLIFLPFISSAFVDTKTMPNAVRVFADNQPVTSVVNTLRALLAAEPVGNEIWVALCWLVGIMVLAFGFAMRIYRRVG